MKEKSSHIEYKLAFVAILFLLLSGVIRYMAPLIFLGIAPLFSLFDLNKQEKITSNQFVLLLISVLSISFVGRMILIGVTDYISLLKGVVHGVLMSLSIIIFWFTDKYSKNKIGYFTIVIYWLALEYCSLHIPDFPASSFLLASTLIDLNQLELLNIGTGLLGVSLWIVVGNILFYYVFFKNNVIFNGHFRWLSFIYTVLLLSSPLVVLYFLNAPESISGFINSVFGNQVSSDLIIDLSQEYLGRTALLFSILMVCYSFVKRQIR